jgi:ribosome maturation factor RimP
MIDSERVEAAITPAIAARGLAVHDVEVAATDGRRRVVRITVRGEGAVDLDTLTELTRALDPIVDAVVPGSYQLEVSSPGLERTLRRPEHFAAARGERVTVKFQREGSAARTSGRLVDADEHMIEIRDDGGAIEQVPLATITSARTVFEWAPRPRPGRGSRPGSKRRAQQSRGVA